VHATLLSTYSYDPSKDSTSGSSGADHSHHMKSKVLSIAQNPFPTLKTIYQQFWSWKYISKKKL